MQHQPASAARERNGPATSSALDHTELLTVREVATALRVSRMTIYRHIHTGQLPAVQFGRSLRVPAEIVEYYLQPTTPATSAEAV